MHPADQHGTESALVREARAGSAPCFEELVLRYEGRVFRFIAGLCGNDADAAELTQETFVSAYRGLYSFDCRQGFAPWLFTIARRKVIDRKRRPEYRIAPPEPELTTPIDPGAALVAAEDRRDLWDTARRILSEQQFHALWLHYVEDMSVEQVAAVLRITRTFTKVQLFRARNHLARHVANHGMASKRKRRSGAYPSASGQTWPVPN